MVGGRPVRLLGVSEGQPCHFGSHERPTAATSGPERPEQGRGLAPAQKGQEKASQGVSEGQPCHFGSHERPTAATSGPERPEQGRGLAPAQKGQEKASQGVSEGGKFHRATVNGWGLGA